MTNLRVTVGNITRRRKRNTRRRARDIIVRVGWESTALFSLQLIVTVTMLTPVNPQPVISVVLAPLLQQQTVLQKLKLSHSSPVS